MENLLKDLRFSLRLLAKDPVTTLVIIAVLGIGVGANAIIFSVVYAKLLRPLPFEAPDRLVQVWEVSPAMDYRPSTISPYNYLDWRKQGRSFDAIAVYTGANYTLASSEGPRRMRGARVTANFFDLLGVVPLMGRSPSAEHDQAGSDVAVMSHEAWQARFSADPEIVGKKLTLDGRPHTVLAVMPPEFRFPSSSVEIWTTPAFELKKRTRSDHFLFGIARLKPDVTLQQAQEDISSVAEHLEQAYPNSNKESDVLLVPLREEMVGDVRAELMVLWAGVGLVLLIACANVANLLMARVVARRAEISMRMALGGSRWRIIRQLMTECLLLASLGGIVGLLLAAWGTRLLASGYGPRALRSDLIELNLWVLGFGVAVTLLTAGLVGVVPSLRATRGDIYSRLGRSALSTTRGGARRLLPKAMIVFQVALAVVLLVAAGLLAKSLILLNRVDVGFDPEGVLTIQLAVPGDVYSTSVERANLYRRVVDRIQAVPGVESVAGVNDLPLSGSRTQRGVEIVGQAKAAGEVARGVDYRTVVGDYFEVLDLEVEGRTFISRYPPYAPAVAIVNQAFVDEFFPVSSPMERGVIVQGKPTRIIGVAENLRHVSRAVAPVPEIYVPMEQGEPPEWLYLAVRTEVAAETLGPVIANAVRSVLPDYPLYNFQTLEERLARSSAPRRFNSLLFSLFAGISLVLVLVGIYGLLSFSVRERTREIAIRMALGGDRGDVIRLMIGQGLVPAILGIGLGLALAIPIVGTLRSLLFGINPTDPQVLILVPLALAGLAALASFVPARRATTMEPVAALRQG